MLGTGRKIVRLGLLVSAVTGFVIATSAVPVSADAGVSIFDNAFQPTPQQIDVGATITWTWVGNNMHSTTSDTGVWDSGINGHNHTFPWMFNSAGIFTYHCQVHGNMHGTIIVGKLLTVSRSGNGAGSVTSNPAGINCPSTCRAAFDKDAPVTLTEYPGTDSSFAGWTGDGTGTLTTRDLTMDGNKTVTARFTANHRPDGKIRLSGTSSYKGNNVYNTNGTGQTVSASVAPGHARTYFVQEENDGTVPDTFKLKGPGSSSTTVVHYFFGTTNITAAVVAGTYSTGTIAPAAAKTYRIVLKARRSAPKSTFKDLLVATSAGGGEKDAVKAKLAIT